MREYRRLLRQFWFYILLAHLTLGGAAYGTWWALLRYTDSAPSEIALLSLLAAYGGFLLLFLIFYLIFVHPLKYIYEQLDHLAAGKLDYRNQHKAGVYGWLAEGLNKLTVELREFLDKAEAESSALEHEVKRLRLVLNSIADGVLALDQNRQVVLFNKAAEQITGYSDEEALTGSINDILPLSEEGKMVLHDWLDSLGDRDLVRKHWERVGFTNKNGGRRLLEVDAFYSNSDTEDTHTLITFRDKTQAQEVEDMKVDFVALAAHELRTPVAVIKGYMDILNEELKDQLEPKHRQFFKKISLSVVQLSGIISNILRVSNIEHGDLSLKVEPIEWGRFLRESTLDLQEQARAKERQLAINVPDDLPLVAADKVSIQEVVNNFIDNAIKYTRRGEGKIEITAQVKDNLVETTISDNGVGIPANLMDKLFTKFYRSHRTRDDFKGTGLGLFIAKSIIEAHGGTVWVHSKEGEGSTFAFTLPTYAKVADSEQNADNDTKITKGVHGWIKNHSLYRR